MKVGFKGVYITRTCFPDDIKYNVSDIYHITAVRSLYKPLNMPMYLTGLIFGSKNENFQVIFKKILHK